MPAPKNVASAGGGRPKSVQHVASYKQPIRLAQQRPDNPWVWAVETECGKRLVNAAVKAERPFIEPTLCTKCAKEAKVEGPSNARNGSTWASIKRNERRRKAESTKKVVRKRKARG